MRHLFLSSAQLASDTVTLAGPEAHHLLNVLRIKPGEALVLLDNEGSAFHAEVAEVSRRDLVLRRLGPAETLPEPRIKVTVAQALGKGDKFEQVVQHGTEAGAFAFIPLQTERTVMKLDARSVGDKAQRWQAIAKSAAEQCGRPRIPEVAETASLTGLLGSFGYFGAVFLLHPGAEPLAAVAPLATVTSCLILVGPEGGFSPAEVEKAIAAGAKPVSVGDYVLRTETAALVAISQLLFAAELRERQS
jgi:16S rRNA (uracil1498-N3)-methyltransferase